MMAIGIILFLAANIVMAWYHSELIKDGVKIKHGLWGGAYLVLAAGSAYFQDSITLFILLLVMRKFVFDTALNLFRGLGLLYVSPELERYTGLWDAIKKGKVIDWVHYKIFGSNSLPYMIFYFSATIILSAALIWG